MPDALDICLAIQEQTEEDKFSLVAVLDRILVEAKSVEEAKLWAFEILDELGYIVKEG